jgi:hypothetical protein
MAADMHLFSQYWPMPTMFRISMLIDTKAGHHRKRFTCGPG